MKISTNHILQNTLLSISSIHVYRSQILLYIKRICVCYHHVDTICRGEAVTRERVCHSVDYYLVLIGALHCKHEVETLFSMTDPLYVSFTRLFLAFSCLESLKFLYLLEKLRPIGCSPHLYNLKYNLI